MITKRRFKFEAAFLCPDMSNYYVGSMFHMMWRLNANETWKERSERLAPLRCAGCVPLERKRNLEERTFMSATTSAIEARSPRGA